MTVKTLFNKYTDIPLCIRSPLYNFSCFITSDGYNNINAIETQNFNYNLQITNNKIVIHSNHLRNFVRQAITRQFIIMNTLHL